MSGVITELGGPIPRVFFSDDLPGLEGTWLAAAVVWRPVRAPRRWGLWSLLRQIRSCFGPSATGFHLRGQFERWSGSWGPNGEYETLYSPERRVVKVLGREYKLPADGQTLVLLVDETGGPEGSPKVTIRTLNAPVVAYPSLEASLGRAAIDEQLVNSSAAEHDVWAAALEQDPEVRAFMRVLR